MNTSPRWMIAGIGTDVGKTIVSAILTTLFEGDYWKPVECGLDEGGDSKTISRLIDTTKHSIHPPAYSLKAPLSPHHAARIENIAICPQKIKLPQTYRPLIIEMAGGILVPLDVETTSLDVYKQWNARWIVVSRHYLGSINHTLLTVEVLKSHGIIPAGIIFNGLINLDTENVILHQTKLSMIGRLFPEKKITHSIIKEYANTWKPIFAPIPR